MEFKKLIKYCYFLFLAILSSILFSISYPNIFIKDGCPFFAYIALIPFFLIIYKSNKLIYIFIPLTGVLSYALFNYWLWNFHTLAYFITLIFIAIQYLILSFLFRYTLKKVKKFDFIALAIVYILYEYVRTIGFLAYPYGIIGYTQYLVPVVRNVSAIGGVFLLSFLIVLPQTFIAKFFCVKSDKKNIVSFSLIYIAFFIIIALSGYLFSIYNSEKVTYKNVMLVQHAGDNWGSDKVYRRNFEILKQLTLKSLQNSKNDVDFIVWSETAFVPGVYWHTTYDTNPVSKELVFDFVTFAANMPNVFITGNSDGREISENIPIISYKSNGERVINQKAYNAALVYIDGKNSEIYQKRKLVPFTETFPYKELLPFVYDFLENNGSQFWQPGKESKTFNYNDINFSINICYEDGFSSLIREDVKKGANLLINITNDSWSSSLPAQNQHMMMSVFRSIETGTTLVRSTNSGMSCVIEPTGKILYLSKPFEKNAEVYKVPIVKNNKTPFLFYGDLFVLLAFVVYIILLISSYQFFSKTKTL